MNEENIIYLRKASRRCRYKRTCCHYCWWLVLAWWTDSVENRDYYYTQTSAPYQTHCKHWWMYRPRDQRDSVQMDQSTSH